MNATRKKEFGGIVLDTLNWLWFDSSSFHLVPPPPSGLRGVYTVLPVKIYLIFICLCLSKSLLFSCPPASFYVKLGVYICTYIEQLSLPMARDRLIVTIKLCTCCLYGAVRSGF
jgi:hypothetical protein